MEIPESHPNPSDGDSDGREREPYWPWWLVLIVLLGFGGVLIWFHATEAPADQGGMVRAAWSEDYDHAVATSQATGRPILVNFTGSDWCDYCIRMRREIFDTGIFAAWAKDHVVLLDCDYPRLSQQSVATVAQNQRLAERYAIESFPTIVILTAQGEELTRVGYRRGGARVWITDIEDVVRRGTSSPKAP